jgi:single-strand DNA-binding protein
MINNAQVTLCGYVATDPRFKQHDSGHSSTRFRVAITERRKDQQTGEWSDGPTTFMDVSCWRGLARNAASSLRKGEPVIVRGRLRKREFTDSAGKERSEIEVDASSIGHDLTRGVAIFSRTRKSPGGTAAEQAEAQSAEAAEGVLADGGPVAEAGAVAAGGTGGGTEAGGDAGPAAGDGGLVDETAVAEFARQLDESLPSEEAGASPVP